MAIFRGIYECESGGKKNCWEYKKNPVRCVYGDVGEEADKYTTRKWEKTATVNKPYRHTEIYTSTARPSPEYRPDFILYILARENVENKNFIKDLPDLQLYNKQFFDSFLSEVCVIQCV